MPVKSEAQRRAMYAALNGKSTIGISKSVAEKFVGPKAHDAETKPHAAGILYVAPDGTVLLVRRSDLEKNYAGHWALPGGGAEAGETPDQTARRESREELGIEVPDDYGDPEMQLIRSKTTPTGLTYYTFMQPVDKKFTPTLNDEHTRHAWASLGDLPEPIHPAVNDLLMQLRGDMADDIAQDSLALDRESVRSYDADKRLHVSSTPISKANICEYYGREIPGAEAMGLEADRKYKLLRDPEELAKAVGTFNHIPLLRRHVPVSAEDHKPEDVIGSTGTDASFDAPYLTNSLVVWSQSGIDDIEKEHRKELSSAYRYRADMTPGAHEGESYDGVMRDIVGNHVALVKKGRAGPDVVVGDEKPGEDYTLGNKFAQDANWSESDHPRDGGKFSSGGGGLAKGEESLKPHEHHETLTKAGWRHNKDVSSSAGKMHYERPDKPGHRVTVSPFTDGKHTWGHTRKMGAEEAAEHRSHGYTNIDDRQLIKGGSSTSDLKEHLKHLPENNSIVEGIIKRGKLKNYASDDLSMAPNSGVPAMGKFKTASDSQPKELAMAKHVLTPKALLAKGALVSFLMPRLAQDAGINLDPVLKDVSNDNYADKRDDIVAGVTKITKGKLAKDAKLDGLDDMLLALDEMDVPEKQPDMTKDKKAKDAAGEGLKEMLKGKLNAEDWKAACDEIDGMKDDDEEEAEDEEDDDEDLRPDPEDTNKAADRRRGAKDARRAKDAEPSMTKEETDKAMDAAIKDERKKQQGVRDAERFVRPWVGDLNLAFDTAEDVFAKALTMRGKEIKGIHPSAYKAVLEMMPKPGTEHRSQSIAEDSSPSKSFSDRFPEAARVAVTG